MPRPAIPRVRPFTIPALNYRFVDTRDLDDRQQADAENAWVRHLIYEYEDQMDSRRERQGLCDWDLRKFERQRRRYERILARRPSLTWDQYEQAGGTVEYDHDGDPRLRRLDFAIFDIATGELVGKMPLINIRIERDVDGDLTATFQGTPGVKIPDGTTRPVVWSRIYRRLIEGDITFRNGRTLDIVGVRFPVSLPNYRFRPRPWNDLGRFLEIMRGLGYIETTASADPEAPEKFRRSDAGSEPAPPPKTPLEEEIEGEVRDDLPDA